MNRIRFQFHKGTIKTDYASSIDPFNLNFNSIKVQLKQNFELVQRVHQLNFNSIKVQLKLKSSSDIEEVSIFQFHKGTIKTAAIK